MNPLLIEILLAWTASLLTCCTALHLWFNTDLRALLLRLLKWAGWRRKFSGVFWPEEKETQLDEMSRLQLDRWLSACAQDGTLPPLLVHVLGCPGCLSVHIANMTALMVLLLWRPNMPWYNYSLFWVAVIATLPWLSCRLAVIKKS